MLGASEEKQMFSAQGGYKALKRVKELIESAPGLLEQMVRGNSQI